MALKKATVASGKRALRREDVEDYIRMTRKETTNLASVYSAPIKAGVHYNESLNSEFAMKQR